MRCADGADAAAGGMAKGNCGAGAPPGLLVELAPFPAAAATAAAAKFCKNVAAAFVATAVFGAGATPGGWAGICARRALG